MEMEKLPDLTNCRFATVAMCDTNGLLRGQKVSRASLEGILEAGMGMSPVTLALDPTDVILDLPGISDEAADFHDTPLVVDPDSARRIPWEAPGDDLLLLANYTGETAALCPRAILTSVLERARDMGLSPKYGLELEYTLFDETAESLAEKSFRDLRPATRHASHDLVIYQAAQSEWYGAVADMCGPLKIDLAKMHEEIGPGFMEACIAAGEGLAPADQCVLLKNFLRVQAGRMGKTVTFMPRWSVDADSQSAHVHVSLKQAGAPVFWQEGAHGHMSARFRHFIGGLQKHAGELMLVFAPTVNSYRRFAEGTFAPPALTWGVENRTTAFRVVGHDAGSLRVENRLPGSDANPYLVVAATLAAGLDGIANGIEPEAETIGNGYVPGTGNGPDFPHDMRDAIAAFKGSEMARDWLGAGFVDGFAATRAAQQAEFAAKVPDVELMRFFELG
ncbi:MAG TPA: glutamine synthetase [Aliiroseovarius sp.]|nr:glutamine synthetase [Aliiroseovarius sp.]